MFDLDQVILTALRFVGKRGLNIREGYEGRPEGIKRNYLTT